MTKDGKDKEICSICMNNDEEDMLLIAKAFLTTFDNFKHWSREGSYLFFEYSNFCRLCFQSEGNVQDDKLQKAFGCYYWRQASN